LIENLALNPVLESPGYFKTELTQTLVGAAVFLAATPPTSSTATFSTWMAA